VCVCVCECDGAIRTKKYAIKYFSLFDFRSPLIWNFESFRKPSNFGLRRVEDVLLLLYLGSRGRPRFLKSNADGPKRRDKISRKILVV
jgi:hypothetical protein